ncbi:MAG: FecR domain-containing protein [Planctomycetaceae bacterium]|nr:FecR domain-containing protein [Planctomycetaceae bacterium]
MTDKELIDGFVAGELDEAAMAQLEAELRANPDLLRELADQQQIEQALKVLLGDDTADQQVTVSVLSVLRADPIDSFKSELLDAVKKEADLKRREEAAAKAPVVPPPAPEVAEAVRPPAPAPARVTRRRVLPWVMAGSVAAAALVALGVALFPSGPKSSAADSHAFLLSVGPGARLHRDGQLLPVRVDMALHSGDRLTIDEAGETRIGFGDDPTRLKLKGPAVFHFVQGGAAKRIELLKGECEIAAPLQVEPFTALTPHSELKFREGDVRLVSAADFARLEVRRGRADFTSRRDHKTIAVAADFYAVAGKDVDLVARALDKTSPSPDGPGVVAVLRRVQGEVFVFSQSPADRTPAKPGRAILEGQAILTEGPRSSVVLDYPDHTRLEIGADTVVRRLTDDKDKTRKLVTLEKGALVADVAKQPAGKAMLLRTPQAEVAVLGTRFTLATETEATRLQVEEGAVNFTRIDDKKTIQVRSGFYAVAAPGKPLDPAPLPGGVRYLDIDLNAGVTSGDGEWTVEGRTVKQTRVSRLAEGGSSTLLCRAESEEKDSLMLEVVADVDQATPDTAIDRGTWGFGLEAMFRDRTVVLRSAQGPEGTSVFEFPGISAIPFEHGREGTYRLKLSIERKRASEAVLRGKIWQGDREPDGWMIENVFEVDGPMTQVGLQTVRCACSFSSFKVKVLKEESR